MEPKVKYPHVMVDIESLGTAPDACVLSIGAVRFSLTEKGRYSFYRNIDLSSCLKAGLKPDGRTFYWWMAQSERAKSRLTSPEPVELTQALQDFKAWFRFPEIGIESLRPWETLVWSHGSNFDQPILHMAHKAVGMWVPWNYKLTRDTRTLFWLARGHGWDPGEPRKPNDRHDALADAHRQVESVIEAWTYLIGGSDNGNSD